LRRWWRHAPRYACPGVGRAQWGHHRHADDRQRRARLCRCHRVGRRACSGSAGGGRAGGHPQLRDRVGAGAAGGGVDRGGDRAPASGRATPRQVRSDRCPSGQPGRVARAASGRRPATHAARRWCPRGATHSARRSPRPHHRQHHGQDPDDQSAARVAAHRQRRRPSTVARRADRGPACCHRAPPRWSARDARTRRPPRGGSPARCGHPRARSRARRQQAAPRRPGH
jgi:hypothetical protein